MRPGLNFNSSRAQQARLSQALANKWLRFGLIAAFLLAFGTGAWLLIIKISAGWLLCSLAVLPVLILVWYEWWLKRLPPAKNPQTVDDVLEAAVLGQMTGPLSPQDVAAIVMRAPGGFFFAIRLGLGPNFLHDLSSPNIADSEAMWQTALQ